MKFKTEKSDSITNMVHGIDLAGYYYPYEETNKVCPLDFRIPTINEWEKYVRFLLELKSIPDTLIEYNKIENGLDSYSGFIVLLDGFEFYDEPNPLNLQESRQIQGSKMRGAGELNFWIRNGESTDFKHHVHIYSNHIWNHSHNHHIEDKKRKKRKFVVRCIRNTI